jgi:hypothetical protein
MTKHTPGPWQVDQDGAGWYIESNPERDHSIAFGRWADQEEAPDANDNEKLANARLIAAAPDLLAACIEVASGYSTRGSEMARAAIAKATGEQP